MTLDVEVADGKTMGLLVVKVDPVVSTDGKIIGLLVVELDVWTFPGLLAVGGKLLFLLAVVKILVDFEVLVELKVVELVIIGGLVRGGKVFDVEEVICVGKIKGTLDVVKGLEVSFEDVGNRMLSFEVCCDEVLDLSKNGLSLLVLVCSRKFLDVEVSLNELEKVEELVSDEVNILNRLEIEVVNLPIVPSDPLVKLFK